ncbi:MFS transporter [Mollisia scopiformis]|uniref:MFS transporter n=1 Tax=Mollisia scopiformis TaxID=149040 RepID=A0A132BBE6_MOLSC|nr:MFS transporter [Mollisia scopiformis]KUJ09735.1 MFS transporter [Mollisia scopiformis]
MEKTLQITSTPSDGEIPDTDIEKVISRNPHLDVEPGQVSNLKDAHIKGVDKAYAYASVDIISIDEKTNKHLFRKIDTHVLPWLLGLYVLQFLDKGILSYAGVMGLQKDTNLTSAQYTWLGSIYYAGYMPAVPIHNRLFQIFPPAKYIACCVIIWGVVLACMSACHNFTALMIQRTALGILEASINCGFSMITAAWYKKYEHGTRVGIWSSMTGVATIVGGIIAYGCVLGEEKHGSGGFSSWKILSLVTGLISVVYGIAMLWFMAGSVVSAKFFSEEEKMLAVERLRDNHQGVGSTQYKKYQLVEAWTDYRTWMYVVFVLTSQIPSAGLVLLSSILIKSLGFDTKTTLLLAMPQGAITILSNAGFGYLADRTKYRSGSAILVSLLALFAVSLFTGLGSVSPLYDRNGQLVAYFIMSGCSAASWFIVISMISSNVLGTTKKASSNSIIFAAQGLAYFIGPQTFRDGPYYRKAKIVTIILWIASIVMLSGFWVVNWLENRKRDHAAEAGEIPNDGVLNAEFMDLTDKENKGFRYVL